MFLFWNILKSGQSQNMDHLKFLQDSRMTITTKQNKMISYI